MSNNNVFFPDDDRINKVDSSDDDELSEDFISDNHSNGSIIFDCFRQLAFIFL